MDRETIITGGRILIEMYRVFMGSMLVLFVPGVCQDKNGPHRCSSLELYTMGTTLYKVSAIFNLITLASFVLLYGAELRRENRLNKYLLVNTQKPTDTDTVGAALARLPEKRRDRLSTLDSQYQILGTITIVLYLVNSVLSGTTIGLYYLDDRTPSAFATNVLFIGGKLFDVYLLVHTDKHILFSAYKRQKVQYNDVQPSKCDAV